MAFCFVGNHDFYRRVFYSLGYAPHLRVASLIKKIRRPLNRMDDTYIMSIVAMVVSIAGAVLAYINHRKCVSNCNGQKIEASLDIDTTQP